MLSKVVSRRFLEVMLLMEDGEERYLWSGMFLPDFDPFWISELGLGLSLVLSGRKFNHKSS